MKLQNSSSSDDDTAKCSEKEGGLTNGLINGRAWLENRNQQAKLSVIQRRRSSTSIPQILELVRCRERAVFSKTMLVVGSRANQMREDIRVRYADFQSGLSISGSGCVSLAVAQKLKIPQKPQHGEGKEGRKRLERQLLHHVKKSPLGSWRLAGKQFRLGPRSLTVSLSSLISSALAHYSVHLPSKC